MRLCVCFLESRGSVVRLPESRLRKSNVLVQTPKCRQYILHMHYAGILAVATRPSKQSVSELQWQRCV